MGQRLDNARSLYLEAIRDGNAAEAITKYSGDRYTQHSTPVRDGPDGFIEFFEGFHKRNPIRDIEIVRAFEDGRYVFLHVVQNLNNGEFRYVTADIFDTDDEAKLIEHWDIIEEMTDTSVNGNTQVDGSTELTDLDKTESNKTIVRAFLAEVLQDGNYGRQDDFVSTTSLIQHNPAIPDGELTAPETSTVYEEVHNVIGCGNFVASLSRATTAGVNTAVIDLFRLEDGLIVEHWDVVEEIMPEDSWVNSGKF